MSKDRSSMVCFDDIQRQLRDPFSLVYEQQPSTVIILPSMTMDHAGLAKIPGVRHYEERLLAFLQLLRRPTTKVIYITSDSLNPVVVDYALDLVSSIPNWH